METDIFLRHFFDRIAGIFYQINCNLRKWKNLEIKHNSSESVKAVFPHWQISHGGLKFSLLFPVILILHGVSHFPEVCPQNPSGSEFWWMGTWICIPHSNPTVGSLIQGPTSTTHLFYMYRRGRDCSSWLMLIQTVKIREHWRQGKGTFLTA